MEFERFDLLYRVEAGHGRARYDLSSSDMPPQRLRDVGGLSDLSLAENHPGGGEPLRKALARLYGGAPEEYVVTAGTSEADFAVCAALLRPGDAVVAETPGYQPLRSIPTGLTGNVTPYVRREEDAFRVDVDALEAILPPDTKLLVLSNLHNPTSAAMDARTLRAVADLAASRGFHVLVDEVFRELAFEDTPPTIGGMNEWTIATSSVTKFYGAGGLRIGWIRASPQVRALARGVLDYTSVSPSGVSERIAVSLLRHRARTVARNRKLIAEGREILRAWAETTPGLDYVEPVAHLAFPRFDADTDALSTALLERHATFLAPGESFGLPRHARLNLGRGRAQLQGGLPNVTKALREAH